MAWLRFWQIEQYYCYKIMSRNFPLSIKIDDSNNVYAHTSCLLKLLGLLNRANKFTKNFPLLLRPTQDSKSVHLSHDYNSWGTMRLKGTIFFSFWEVIVPLSSGINKFNSGMIILLAHDSIIKVTSLRIQEIETSAHWSTTTQRFGCDDKCYYNYQVGPFIRQCRHSFIHSISTLLDLLAFIMYIK